MNTPHTQSLDQDQHHGSLVSYSIGFLLSLIMTFVAFGLVMAGASGALVIAAISVLAVLQLLVQLVFFLHLGKESNPRWNLAMFIFAAIVIGVVVIGSLWIMHHLDYNMMPAKETDAYMLEQKDKGF